MWILWRRIKDFERGPLKGMTKQDGSTVAGIGITWESAHSRTLVAVLLENCVAVKQKAPEGEALAKAAPRDRLTGAQIKGKTNVALCIGDDAAWTCICR